LPFLFVGSHMSINQSVDQSVYVLRYGILITYDFTLVFFCVYFPNIRDVIEISSVSLYELDYTVTRRFVGFRCAASRVSRHLARLTSITLQ